MLLIVLSRYACFRHFRGGEKAWMSHWESDRKKGEELSEFLFEEMGTNVMGYVAG